MSDKFHLAKKSSGVESLPTNGLSVTASRDWFGRRATSSVADDSVADHSAANDLLEGDSATKNWAGNKPVACGSVGSVIARPRKIFDINRITLDDKTSKMLQLYDGYLLYHEKDMDFAFKVLEYLGEQGFKICDRERDFLPGVMFEHDAVRQILTNRCERLIVILSPNFCESPVNEYVMNLGQALGIKERSRKVIPCVYKDFELPEFCFGLQLLHYMPSPTNFYDKLRRSLNNLK